MLDVVINGGWGVRVEDATSVAERWSTTLEELKGVDRGSFHAWHEADDGLPSDPLLLPTVPALTDYIKRENVNPDVDVIGYGTSLWAHNHGMPKVGSVIRAGGSSLYVTNSISVSFRSRTVDETAEVVRRAPEILHIIAEAWEIDTGQVYNRTQYRAVSEHFDLENPDPRCGRAVYLSERRAALAPEGLPGTYVRTAAGGLIIDLTRGGTESPTDETIIEVNAALRAAGALEPLPTPYDRPVF
ncbi:Imm52 family immunity protein [Streptomyces sp. NPDC091267]|uniref:Imm52 family immunity protein n=1 Tax=unclassified Streptomyces TaxID=2593676 RepID=UPI00343320D2